MASLTRVLPTESQCDESPAFIRAGGRIGGNPNAHRILHPPVSVAPIPAIQVDAIQVDELDGESASVSQHVVDVDAVTETPRKMQKSMANDAFTDLVEESIKEFLWPVAFEAGKCTRLTDGRLCLDCSMNLRGQNCKVKVFADHMFDVVPENPASFVETPKRGDGDGLRSWPGSGDLAEAMSPEPGVSDVAGDSNSGAENGPASPNNLQQIEQVSEGYELWNLDVYECHFGKDPPTEQVLIYNGQRCVKMLSRKRCLQGEEGTYRVSIMEQTAMVAAP